MTSSAEDPAALDPAALGAVIDELTRQIDRFRAQGDDARPVEGARDYLRAQLARRQGDPDAMQAWYRAAIDTFRAAGIGRERAVVATEAAQALQEAGRLDAALACAADAIAGAELVWMGASPTERLQPPRELVEAADVAVPLAFAAGAYETMFDFVQRSKARWFTEQLLMGEVARLPGLAGLFGPAVPTAAVDAAAAQLDRAWDAYYGGFSDAVGDPLAAAEAALLAAYAAETARRRRLRPLLAAAADPAACRKALREGEGLVELFVTTRETFALVLTRDQLHVEPLGIPARALRDGVLLAAVALQQTPSRPDFEREINGTLDVEQHEELRGRASVLHALYPAPRDLLATLGGILLAPLDGALTGLRRLVVCPHWDLHLVPFHALGMRSGRPLAATTAVTYAPSTTAWFAMARLRRDEAPAAGPRPVAVLGVERRHEPQQSWFSRQLTTAGPPGPPSVFEEEATAVAAASGAAPVLGAAAGKDAFYAALAEADVVHLSCHNALGRPNVLTDGLLLADGIVTLAELSVSARPNARPGKHPQLVVLSACRSGLDRVDPGDLRVSLGDVLVRRFGCSVVSSLWPVDAEATALLMGRMYAHREAAGDWAEALRLAQVETMATTSQPAADGSVLDFSDPYYWAGFFMLGP